MTTGGVSKRQKFCMDETFCGQGRIAAYQAEEALKLVREMQDYFHHGERGTKCQRTVNRARRMARDLHEMLAKIDEFMAVEQLYDVQDRAR